MTGAVELTLVHARGGDQQAALDAWLSDVRPGAGDERQCAVVVEGASFGLKVPEDVQVIRIAAGCVCCMGQVPLRAAVARSARAMDGKRARAVLLLVSNGEHLPRLRDQIERGDLGRGIHLRR